MQEEEQQVSLNYILQNDVAPMEEYSAYAVLNLTAPEMRDLDEGKRPQLAISAVLDRSGSMSSGKLDLTKTAMHFIAEQLHHDDLFGIVTYDDVVSTEFDLTKAHPKNKEVFEGKINNIETGGCTNLSGGLLCGIDQQAQARKNSTIDDNSNIIRAVLLCTDGLANTGITNSQQLEKITRSKISEEKNLRVHTFGFGDDHDPRMLTGIAQAGQGDFFYVGSDDAIPEAFGNVLGGLLSVAAQNIRLVITPLEASFRVIKIWDKVVGEKHEKTGEVVVTLRDLKSEDIRKLLFEYSLAKCKEEEEGVKQVAKVDLHYFNVITEKSDHVSCILSVNRQKNVPQNGAINQEIAQNIARAQTAKAVEEATTIAENRDLEAARRVVQKAKQDLQNLKLSDDGYEQRLFRNLDKLEHGFQDMDEYQNMGRFYGYAATHGMSQQAAVFSAGPKKRAQPKAREVLLLQRAMDNQRKIEELAEATEELQASATVFRRKGKQPSVFGSLFSSIGGLFMANKPPVQTQDYTLGDNDEEENENDEEEFFESEQVMNKVQMQMQKKAQEYNKNKK